MNDEILISDDNGVKTFASISGDVVVIVMKDHEGNTLFKNRISYQAMVRYQKIMNVLEKNQKDKK